MKVQEVAIEKIKPYWRNPRKRSADSVTRIADSIAAFGWQQPIVVDKEFVVIIGHGRLEAAKRLEAKQVPVVVAASLSPEKAKALRLADNRTNRDSDCRRYNTGKAVKKCAERALAGRYVAVT